ncbi:hypothetical protein ACFFTQ_33390 [Streptomyces roseofulvus]
MSVEICTRQDWETPGWREQADSWIGAVCAELGIGIVHSIRQTHVRAWSTVMRVEVGERVVWFKANNEAARHEAALLLKMGEWTPGAVPAVIAADTDLGWFLTEDAGPDLASLLAADSDVRHWEAALSEYGALQRSLEPHVSDMLALGVPDCRPAAMPGLLDDMLGDPGVCGVDEPAGMTQEVHTRLLDFRPRFAAMCDELDAYGILPSLQHDDLHRSNVFVADGRHCYLDWADASAAHPFGSLIYPLLQAAELPGGRDPVRIDRLRDAYLEPWTDALDRSALRTAADLSVKVASVGRAMVWRRAVTAGDRAALKEYYATGVPRWLQKILPA